ncbi:MAG: hypothetical protein V1728_06280 [Candidatus Micrarchaeota archaeon]
MQKILKKRMHANEYGDLEVTEVISTGDQKYADGIKYSLFYLQQNPATGRYSRLFGIDNSHGEAHIHLKGKKVAVDYDWKAVMEKFDEMARAHRKTRGEI